MLIRVVYLSGAEFLQIYAMLTDYKSSYHDFTGFYQLFQYSLTSYRAQMCKSKKNFKKENENKKGRNKNCCDYVINDVNK